MRGHQLFTKLDFKPTQGQNLRYSQADGKGNNGLTFSNSWDDTAFDEELVADSASRMTDMTAPNSQKQPENKVMKRTVTMWTEIDSSEANEGGEPNFNAQKIGYQRPGTMKPIRMIIAEEEPAEEQDDQNVAKNTHQKLLFNPKVNP